jgi:defect-in-organelle-trafficking protein DotB
MSAMLAFPEVEPARLDLETANGVLLWASEQGASDVYIQTDEPIGVKVHGEVHRASRRRLTDSEIEDLLAAMYGPSGVARVKGGEDVDWGYEVALDERRTKSRRFRCNATGCASRYNASQNGIVLTFRVIASVPPTLVELELEPEVAKLHESTVRQKGLVLVVGETGTGKTTLLAAMLADQLQRFERVVVSYEAPIEYTLQRVESRRGYVAQVEVPRHLPSFAHAARNAMRRGADVLLVGEARDQETMRELVQLGLAGNLVYSTVHVQSVAATPARVIGFFPSSDRRGIAVQLLDSLRGIVHQRLLPRVGGGRVAIRECLEFDADLRMELLRSDPSTWTDRLHQAVQSRGLSLVESARRKRDAGVISEESFAAVMAEWGREEVAA